MHLIKNLIFWIIIETKFSPKTGNPKTLIFYENLDSPSRKELKIRKIKKIIFWTKPKILKKIIFKFIQMPKSS